MTWRQIICCLLATLMLLTVGCRTIDPLVVSDRVQAWTPSEDALADLRSARAAALELQNAYLSAARTQSLVPNVIGVLLIPLAAYGIYKGVISDDGGSHHRLAAAGLAGSAAYVFGNTFTSRTRQQVYWNGVEALNCTIGVADAWQASMRQLPELQHSQDELQDRLAELRGEQIRTGEQVEAARSRRRSHDAARPRQCDAPRPDCTAQPAGELRQLCEAQAGDWDRDCRVRPASRPRTEAAAAADLQAAQVVEADAEATLAEARQLQAELGNAGTSIHSATQKIQSSVNREVAKTEPDLKAILDAARSLSSGPLRFDNGQDEGPGVLQSGEDAAGGSRLTGRLRERSAAVRSARLRLQQVLAQIRASIHAVPALSECPGVKPVQLQLESRVGNLPPAAATESVSSAQLETISRNLCVEPAGSAITQALRVQVRAFQRQHALGAQDGRLDPATRDAILALQSPDCPPPAG